MVENSDVDELGLPRFIVDDNREVTGISESHEITVNLLEQPAELDKVRVLFRNGAALVVQEMWQNGVVVFSLQTNKGQKQFAVYDPRFSGMSSFKVSAQLDIL